jgi:hypothetical protein
MKYYYDAEIFDKELTPHTSKLAKPTVYKTIENKACIVIKNATYRDAEFSGAFLLADSEAANFPKSGFARVEVYCRWFDRRLKTRGIKILVDLSKCQFKKNYSGQIVTNLSL